LGIGTTLKIFETRGNVEEVEYNSVRTERINGRRSLMKTSGKPSKPSNKVTIKKIDILNF
jgi:hypothetical protein